MQFGTYEPQTSVEGDRLQAQQITDRPLLVFVADHVPEHKGQFGVKDAVFVDVKDLSTGDIYVSVLWMGGAVVDNLKPFLGQAVGVKLIYRQPKGQGKPYIIPVPLEGTEAKLAYDWAVGDPQMFERVRDEKGIPQAIPTQQARTGLTAATTPPPAAPAPPVAPQPPAAPQAPVAPPRPAAPVAPPAPVAPQPPAAPVAPQPPAAPVAPPAPAAPVAPAPPAPAAAAGDDLPF